MQPFDQMVFNMENASKDFSMRPHDIELVEIDGQLFGSALLIDNSDPDLFMWISGRKPVPPEWDTEIMTLLKNFKIG